MLNLHATAAGPDAEDHSSEMSGRAGALGPGVEGDRRLDVLMAEELPYQLVFAGVPIEINLGGGVPEPMRRHVEPRIGVDQLFDLAAEGSVALVLMGQFAGEQKRARSGTQQWPELGEINLQEFDRFLHQREFEVARVFYLCGRKTQVNGSDATNADLKQMSAEIDTGEVLDANRRVEQQLDRQRGLDNLAS